MRLRHYYNSKGPRYAYWPMFSNIKMFLVLQKLILYFYMSSQFHFPTEEGFWIKRLQQTEKKPPQKTVELP